jgi:hypothetical protein
MGILLNSNKTKISNNSHRIALQKLEKYIEETVNKVDKEGTKKLSFTQLGIIMTELKIFREIINKDPKKDLSKEYSTCNINIMQIKTSNWKSQTLGITKKERNKRLIFTNRSGSS